MDKKDKRNIINKMKLIVIDIIGIYIFWHT